MFGSLAARAGALVLGCALAVAGCEGTPSRLSPGQDGSTATGTACGDSAFFTACVHQCGEATDNEPVAATCVQGMFHCDAPLTPASDCPSGSWTSARLPCGPWPGTYDCGLGCALCAADGTWTCGSCPDASR